MQQKHENITLNDVAILWLLAGDKQPKYSREKLKRKKKFQNGLLQSDGGQVVKPSVSTFD